MELQVLYLDSEDDIVSIGDRLEWTPADRVLLVLPETGDVLTDWLDLRRLRRKADILKQEIGLVTNDSRVKHTARQLGFPVFNTVRAGQNSSRRVWWRGRRARLQADRASAHRLMDEYDREEVYRRLAPKVGPRVWLMRYAGILVFCLTLAVAYIGLLYALPTATITLKPFVESVRASQVIVADPQLEAVNAGGASVPARLIVVTSEWQASVDTTGTVEVPDAPARGNVLFVNLLDEPVTVPAGTRVSTSTDTRTLFQTLREIEVPGAVGGTAEVEIVAIEPGPQGNLETDLINRIEGPLAIQLEVRNLEPTEGGGNRVARAVTEADQERLRAQVLQFLQAVAAGEMEAGLLPGEFLAQDSLRIVAIYQETFSHFLGEQTDSLTLEIRAEIHGTAVDAARANELVFQALVANVLPGYELVPTSLSFYSGEVIGVDGQGRVSFQMIGEGRMAATLSLAEPLAVITGQEPAVAMTYLDEQLPLREFPTVRVWPTWFNRVPYLRARIQTDIDTGG